MSTIEKRFRRNEGNMEMIPTEQELALPIWLFLMVGGFVLVSALGLIMSRRHK